MIFLFTLFSHTFCPRMSFFWFFYEECMKLFCRNIMYLCLIPDLIQNISIKNIIFLSLISMKKILLYTFSIINMPTKAFPLSHFHLEMFFHRLKSLTRFLSGSWLQTVSSLSLPQLSTEAGLSTTSLGLFLGKSALRHSEDTAKIKVKTCVHSWLTVLEKNEPN